VTRNLATVTDSEGGATRYEYDSANESFSCRVALTGETKEVAP
jgi:hypothetical protein